MSYFYTEVAQFLRKYANSYLKTGIGHASLNGVNVLSCPNVLYVPATPPLTTVIFLDKTSVCADLALVESRQNSDRMQHVRSPPDHETCETG